eukprot:m.89640 g.89640  ORF g.89640 m.89640 type:complete len:207 (+) comp51053_c0_seq2:634-1254(+)
MTMAFALPQVEIMWNGQTPNAIEFQDFEPLDGGEDLLLQPLSPGSFASLQLSPVSLFEQANVVPASRQAHEVRISPPFQQPFAFNQPQIRHFLDGELSDRFDEAFSSGVDVDEGNSEPQVVLSRPALDILQAYPGIPREFWKTSIPDLNQILSALRVSHEERECLRIERRKIKSRRYSRRCYARQRARRMHEREHREPQSQSSSTS